MPQRRVPENRREGDHPRSGVPPARLIPAAAGLAALAVSHPVLDLIARQPQFLVAHGLGPAEVVLAALLIVSVPALSAGLAALGGRLGSWVGAGLVGLPTALIGLYLGGRAGLEGVSPLLIGAAAGGAAGVLYARHRSVQDPARYLALVPPVVLVYFFAVVPSAVLAGADPGEEATVEVSRPHPVVVVVFDELPLASLIDAGGAIQEERFPAFGRLAEEGVWYRNAITVETRTTEAIPSILSGRLVPDDTVPNPAHHPHTLFTLLGGSHHVAAVEPVTDLCPERICRGEEERGGRWRTLVSDLAVVYGHLVVPGPWSERLLPPIDQDWAGFTGDPPEASWDLMEAVGEAVEGDRRRDVSRFLSSLSEDHGPPLLRVAHFMLPHRPWEFLPDGTPHGQESMDGYGGRGWGSDEFFVAEGWRRHLLQVGYADTVIGSVMERLEQGRMYDESLVVVVADHGVHFDTDVEDMRVTNRSSLGSILPVPLFVKYPMGLEEAPPPGTIDDRRAETVDVVPTILDVLAADSPVELDGHSLLADFSRTGSVLELRGEPFPVGPGGGEKLAVAERKERWFPDGDPWALVPDPRLRDLVGRSLPSRDDPTVDVQLPAAPAPPLVEGRVTSTEALSGDELVALTADQVVIAVTKVRHLDDEGARFSFLIDPERAYPMPLEGWLLVNGRLVG